MSFGEFIYKFRLLNKLTVLSFSYDLNVDPFYVYSLENDLIPYDDSLFCELLQKISYVYGLLIPDLDQFHSNYSQNLTPPIYDRISFNINSSNKNAISAIRVPDGLILSDKQWEDVVFDFNSKLT